MQIFHVTADGGCS